jgi:Leucine-rich repeat (LRR) protein
MPKHRICYLSLVGVAVIICCACCKKEQVIDGSKAGFLADRSSGDLVLTISELEELGMAEPVSLSDIAAKMNSQQRALITGIDIINGGKIADLKGLGLFPNLRNLYIEGSLLIDMKSVENNKLEILSLQNGRLSSLDGIEAMKDLVGLNISGNPIRHLKGVSELARLRFVDISKTGITSLDDEDMPISLETIYYRDSSLTSIAAFQRAFRTLKEFDVTHNNIATLDDVTDWGGLKYLNVFMNPLMETYRGCDGSIPERFAYKGITLLFESNEN